MKAESAATPQAISKAFDIDQLPRNNHKRLAAFGFPFTEVSRVLTRAGWQRQPNQKRKQIQGLNRLLHQNQERKL